MVMVVVVIMMMVFRAFREAGSGQFKFQFEEEMGASQSHQTIQGQLPSALILWFSLLGKGSRKNAAVFLDFFQMRAGCVF